MHNTPKNKRWTVIRLFEGTGNVVLYKYYPVIFRSKEEHKRFGRMHRDEAEAVAKLLNASGGNDG